MAERPVRAASSHRPGPPARGSCPHCGTETDGVHIAGTVYDFQCEPCVAQVDADFAAFVDRLIEETEPDAG